MKLATITYNGSVREKTHRAPSGQRYVFSSGEAETDSLADGKFFAEKPNYEVRWTASGMLARHFADGYSDAKTALKELGYRKKQQLAKRVDIKANQSEDDLEEELEEFAEELQFDMEHQ